MVPVEPISRASPELEVEVDGDAADVDEGLVAELTELAEEATADVNDWMTEDADD